MIEILIVLAGSMLAGIWDLKTTEVPDEIPYLMISGSLFVLYIRAMITGVFDTLFLSMLIGTIVLAFGLAAYKAGKWGEADAWILAAMFYAIPFVPFSASQELFIVPYILNMLIVTVFYTAIYTVFLGFRHKIGGKFRKEVRNKWKFSVVIPVIYVILLPLTLSYPSIIMGITGLFVLLFLLALFWVYAKVIEKNVFTRRISTRQLREGDVLSTMIWRGLTKKEVSRLRRSKKYVTIKEGIRFVPVFAITLFVTLVWGNLFFLFFLF